ncbi:hypothetical protein NADE_001239 [Nannochloris sp. 'desiccata']|nr:hypothetical protein NADE_001239 [Chlorella desiccata (nom. nud.)]
MIEDDVLSLRIADGIFIAYDLTTFNWVVPGQQQKEVKYELFKRIDANSVEIKAVLAAVNECKTQAGEWRLQVQAAMYTAVPDAETRTNAKINGLTNNFVNASLMAPRVPSAAGNIP